MQGRTIYSECAMVGLGEVNSETPHGRLQSEIF